ncbi:MAG: hypothetical protein IRZ09_08155 [Variibacter sp.]|nr:hypothetical protein [Variibacter sp.]
MVDAYASQSAALRPFGVSAERLRAAPAYRFTASPHAHGAYYDGFDWGMRSDRWRALAAQALARLEGGPC